MNEIQHEYERLCRTPSDIYQHLPTLREYASECSHITECGVRGLVSIWALASAHPKKLIGVDITSTPAMRGFEVACRLSGIDFQFYCENDLTCPLEETDLLFIDTWHVYGQMKRELARWHPVVRKYILLHDTTVDAEQGESLRCGMNIPEQSKSLGIPEHEIRKGIWPAVEEFLANHSDWILHKRYTNNNGLTILKKV
jgi:hypothetical protein